jgi:serine/threonine-protein kinase
MDQASLSVETVEEFSEGKARGVVLRVEPDAGSELGKESTVRLVVSKGKERYAVPTLVGARLGGAGEALSPLNLRLGDQSQDWSETVPKGVVISQDPAPGASVKRNTAVSVVVSKGRRPIDVPTVTGTPFDAASAAITKAGLTVRRGEDVNSDSVPTGQVVSQSPDKGTLHRGDPVTLVVSKGPVMVQVPDVVDQPDVAAEKALTDLGLTVDKQYPFGDLFEKKVRAQDPGAGTSVPKGTTVHLTIV